MENVKIKNVLFFCLLVFLIFSCTSILRIPKSKLPCNFNKELWVTDTCGTNGYKRQMGFCLIEYSHNNNKPVFKNEQEVIHFLGNPDTILTYDNMTKSYFYAMDGGATCMYSFPSMIVVGMKIYISPNNKVTNVSGVVY